MDISNMSPNQLRMMINQFSQMPEEQIKSTMKLMGVDLDIPTLKKFIEQMKNATDEDLEKFKEQFKSGKVNMNSFKKEENPLQKYEDMIKEATKLSSENKHVESIEKCNEILSQIKDLPESDNLKQLKL